MLKEYLIGVDIGTLGSKGVLIDAEGHVLSTFFVEHGIEIPRPGWAEHNPEKIYWDEFKLITSRLIKDAGISADRVVGVGVSSLSPDACPIDENGNPIRNALIYMDRRATDECNLVRQIFGEDKIFKITGNAIDPYFAGYKMLWIMRNELENYRKTWKFLNACKYVVYKLTEVASIDISNAAINAPFFDISRKTWSDEVCEKLNFDKEKLPDIYELGSIIGTVTRKASEECMLPEGTPVISCAPDALMSYYSVGGLDPGDAVFMYGTTGCCGIVTEKRVLDKRFINAFYIGGRLVLTAGLLTVGALVRWFRDEFGFVEREVERLTGLSAYSLLDREAERIPPGSDGLIVLPYFMGERTPIWDPMARGLIFGLTLYHTRAHIFKAILESTGYALRQHMEIARELGVEVRRIVAVNGGARSRLWRQIVSDILEMPQQYISKATGAPYGDAFLAGVAVKIFKDPAQIREYVKIDEEIRPNPENSKKYRELYKIYLELYPKLRENMHKLSQT
ncbi:FGGY-family carbohydrate kinase [Candidatus Bathyarchaeota archaeon]|nr:FGGY-family carbohydrate kinase [Candidatus Bathyarchaeota archaeon]